MNEKCVCLGMYSIRNYICNSKVNLVVRSETENQITSKRPILADWQNPNPHFPKSLYELDYSAGFRRTFNRKTKDVFKSNRQVQEDFEVLYAQTKDEQYNITSLVRTAERSFDDLHTIDFRNINGVFSRLVYDYGNIGSNVWTINKYANAINTHQVVSFGRMITDRSLVYVDTDGRVRVRGYACVYISQGSAQYRKECGFKRGWNFFVVEFAFSYMKKDGWKFSPYVVSCVEKMNAGANITLEEKLALINQYGGIALQKRTRSLHVRDKSA